VSEGSENARIACTWCGLFSSPGFCDSCGSPLPAAGFIEPDPMGSPLSSPTTPIRLEVALLSADDPSVLEAGPVLPAEFSEEPLAPDETYALVEDPTPLVRAPADPEPPEPIESALPVIEPALTPPESPVKAPEALVPASEPTVAPAQPPPAADQPPHSPPAPITPAEQRVRPPAEPPEETTAGPSCPSCRRPGRGGLCDTCREALRELSALGR